MAEASYDEYEENQMNLRAALASLGPSLGVGCPYLPPRHLLDPAEGPSSAPSGWSKPMMTPSRQPDDQPPLPTGKPLSISSSPGNLSIDFGPTSTPASPENSEDRRPPSPHQYNYPPPPIPGVLAMFMVIADDIKLDLAEAHHVAKFLAHPLESYDTNADLKPEITSMTTAVYAQFMKGLAHPEPRRSFERMRRTLYKRKVKAGNRQLTRDNLELRQQLRDAQQTIINLQEQVVQLRDAQQTIIDLQEQVMQLTADLQHMAPYTQGGPNGGQNYGQNYGGYYYY
ncbi:uncharacterized protein LOC119788596 [Cyprinodon tularosa]|uniref:uncharacterized protein LOC119788596 n=1 Tax=Cyprinodon tularosa TaxID=77115 RepID=UPI0018E2871F|nr:uncharacterized protein LOC119773686 isoform X2 [Cyprinodon tularosa]XP_038149036.1 uncharacterized protein LOC119788596 [Cyprinodon tularosa]